jgi:hypothetical protein
VEKKLNKLVQAITERELTRAISAGEEASANYYGILRRFLSTAPASPDEKRLPGARLDAEGLKEIDIAWNKLDIAEKAVRNAYMKLYRTYL